MGGLGGQGTGEGGALDVEHEELAGADGARGEEGHDARRRNGQEGVHHHTVGEKA